MILIHELSHVYSPGTVFEKKALDHVDLKIEDGEILGIIGHTGSGKSTLIQHLNGLLKPTEGAVYFNGEDIHDKDFSMKKLRSKIGLVFQYPEHQLFESTVIEDVQFGPKNMGLDPLEMEMRSFEALKQVGMGEEYLDVSPLELSGGQKRQGGHCRCAGYGAGVHCAGRGYRHAGSHRTAGGALHDPPAEPGKGHDGGADHPPYE